MGKQLGSHWRGLWEKNWSITDKAQIPKVADEIVSFLVKEGLPFFDKYSDEIAAFRALAKDDAEAISLKPLDDVRAKNAIGLAFLIYGRERAKQVAESKLSWLRTNSPTNVAAAESWVNRFFSENAGTGP